MRRTFADTTALLIYWTIANGLNEWLVAGMTWSEIAHARAVGVPVLFAGGRPYGLWRDAFLRRGHAQGGPPLLWDTAALLSFWLPVYWATIYIGGARGDELLQGMLGAAAIITASGRPYGVWLDWVRRRFGLRQPA